MKIEDFCTLNNLEIISAIEHDNAISSKVYNVFSDAHGVAVLKLLYDEVKYNREIFALKLLHAHKSVPRLYETWNSNNIFAILIEKKSGEIVFEDKITPDISYKMGMLIGEIHAQYRSSSYHDPGKKERYRNAMEWFDCYVKRSILELSSNVDSEILSNCIKYYEYAKNKMFNFDVPVFVHRDYRPGNIIVDSDEITGGIVLKALCISSVKWIFLKWICFCGGKVLVVKRVFAMVMHLIERFQIYLA